MNVTATPFELSNAYYDLLYKDKNYQEEATYVDKLVQKYSPFAKKIIELGSGTGNYSKHLAALGYTITGVELEEEMNRLARCKPIPNFTSVTSNIISFELNDVFDAAVALFHVIGYLTTNNEIVSCFKKVASHLKPHGIFVFDVWYTPAVYFQGPKVRIKQVENETLFITRKANPTISYTKNIVEVEYDIVVKNKNNNHLKTLRETHIMRHFSIPEIELIAEVTGYKLLASEEFLTAKEPGKDTWGVCYILQKYD